MLDPRIIDRILFHVRDMGWMGATGEEVAELLPLAMEGDGKSGRWMTEGDLGDATNQILVAWRLHKWRLGRRSAAGPSGP